MSDTETPTEEYIGPFRRHRRTRLPRWLLLLLALFAGGILTCGVGWLGVVLLFSPAHTVVPAEVEAIAQRVAPLRLPPQFQPTWGWEADHSLAWIQLARFDQQAGRGVLLIGELHLRPVVNPQEVPQLRNLLEQGSPDRRLIAPQQTRQSERMVRGHKVSFEIVEGEDRASTTRLRQVTGTFPGREGTAVLILQGEVDVLSDAAIDDVLQSLTEAAVSPTVEPQG